MALVDAPNPQLEVALQTVPGASTPVLDQRQSVEQQLAGAPRFVRDDGTAQLFHRYVDVNFWRNEDYDPKPVYGYANGQIAFTFTASHVVGCFLLRDPILMNRDVQASDFIESQVQRGKMVALTPTLRLWDEFFFAVVDICALTTGPYSVERPTLTERHPEELHYYRARWPSDAKYWNGLVFGSHLQMVEGLPMRTPLGMAHTSFKHVIGSR